MVVVEGVREPALPAAHLQPRMRFVRVTLDLKRLALQADALGERFWLLRQCSDRLTRLWHERTDVRRQRIACRQRQDVPPAPAIAVLPQIVTAEKRQNLCSSLAGERVQWWIFVGQMIEILSLVAEACPFPPDQARGESLAGPYPPRR